MTKRLKVLQLCAVGFTVEKLLMPLVTEMGKTYDVRIACSRDAYSERVKGRGYPVDYVCIDRKISPLRNMKSIWNLYQYFRREKFDIVHVHTPVAGILGRMAAKLAGVPVVIYTAHGFYFHDNMPPLKKNAFILFEKIAGWLSDFIFTQSTEDYETAIQTRIIARDMIQPIGNGVDIQRFNIGRLGKDTPLKIHKEFGITDGDIVVGIIGRVVREKGYMEWVQAAAEVVRTHPNVKFIAIGDTLESDRDGIKPELDRFVEANGLQNNIIFAGSRQDIPELLSAIDVFTLPSYREGMPRSLIEAMAMSVPAIATDIRGCREEVVEGVTGYLIPVHDAKSLAERIITLVEQPELRKRMGEKARERAEKEFDEKVIIQRQLDQIERLVREKIKR